MLEGLVAWVLNTYLGKYVNNLNTDQLSVALLKGAVELENLPLKKDALKELELPFEVKAGFIGKIRIQIPFYRPHLDPWVISISRLHLVGSPDKQEDFDELTEKLLENARKKVLLKVLEEKWKSEQEQKGESYWYSVTASIVTRIVDNIELKIQDVHLRFEDGITNPSHPFAFGVCIKNVSVQNASHEPVEKFLRKKQLEVEDFSIYWDVNSTLLGDLPPGELQDAMDKSMEGREHQYILKPVCSSALLKRNCSKEPLRSRHQPRIECDICLKTIPLTLSQAQYQQIVEFVDEFDRKERQMKYRKWRPKVPVLKNCREWWLFALNANLSEIQKQRQRLRLEFLLHRAKDAVFYCEKHYNRLQGMQLSAEHEAELDRIEEEQSIEELSILRQQVHDRLKKQHELAESLREPMSDPSSGSPVTSPGNQGSGMLQYLQSWFPGWGGWYGNPQEASEDIERLTQEQQQEQKAWNPEDILGTEEFFDPTSDAANLNTFTKRDHVFVKLNFRLEGGTITLLHKEKNSSHAKEAAFMQLEFSGMAVRAESLPRRDSSLLLVQLGGLFLRDLATQGTIFPELVYPNAQKEVVWSQQSGVFMASADVLSPSNSTTGEDPVFKMLYEKNPVHSVFERRLEVSTRPLNIIYNPQAITKVADFFYQGKVHSSGFGYQSELELRVAEAARRQYNKLKMQTKAEIRQTIDRLLVGEFIENSRRWTLRLDICAPHVIFPDDFLSKDPVLVVVDLGRILLTNSQDHCKRKVLDQFSAETNELSDDEYKTPLATPTNSPPPEMDVKAGVDTSSSSGTQLTEEQLEAYLLSNKMYEKYSLSFKDLQIMVGHVKDNWKHIQDNEVGPTHVVEKFNVHLQLERRLIYTSDPQYPGAVLSGTLPDLKIHINEDKIFALRKCITSLSSSESRTADNMLLRKEKIFMDTENYERMQDSVRNLTQSIVTLEQHTREVLVESKLLLAEFKINYMQLGVESCGRYISLLKVFGSNAHFVKRPYDAEVSLTVHGLLMVDTMQTYGSDFDLLMASHKNLCLDAPTGSLRESRAQSPVSETNDFTPSNSYMNQNQYNSLENISLKDQESLIKIEYQFVSSECPSMNLDSSLQVMTVQVNNLDIILNPETMVELIAFLQKSFPRDNIDDSPQPLKVDFETDYRKQESYQSTYEQNTQVAIDINRLNILLFRTVTLPDANSSGRKIATASIGGTKVNVSLGSRFSVNGSLGCLQLMDLAQESSKTQYVISIGNTAAYENQGSDADCFEGFFVRRDETYVPMEALSFTFTEQSKEEFALNLKMASLHYNHSAKFLKELTLSMDELEDNFRNMLKTAASKVSSVLATKTAEYSEMVSLFETPRKHRDSMQYETDEYDGFCPINVKTDTVKLILNINIESPVVSIPRSPGSPELLVGHLGQIFIQNFVSDEEQSRSDRLHVEIKDIKLYSLNSSVLAGRKEFQCSESASSRPVSSSASVSSQEEPHFTRSDFFESLQKNQAFHILHNTTIQFKMEKFNIERDCELTFSCMEDSVETGSILKIEGNFVNYVQVVLAKHVYEQVLQTLDNLIYNEDLNKLPQSSASPSSPVTPEKHLSKSPDDQRERHLFDSHSFRSMSSKSVSTHEKTPFTQIQANFRISELQIQLSGDLTLGAQGLVSLKFQDFDIEFNKDHPHTLAIQIALRSLLMEDLLEKNPDSKYKNLMVSRGAPKASSLGHKEYLSQSCPLVSHVEYPDMPRSLPSHMEEAPNVFQLYQRPTCTSRKKPSEEIDAEYPLTPPPSPTAERSKTPYTKDDFDESLVHINVFLVDKKHPEFSSKYKRINRSVNVDFNCLDVLVTLQTWVVILDFFGIGSTADNHAMKPEPADMRQSVRSEASTTSGAAVQEHTNTKMDLKVHSLSLVLKKTSSELAKASVSKLTAHLENVEGDLALQGSIGSLSLSDLTVHGELYTERFTTSGDEALIFQIFKYGSPDPKLKREYDMRVSLRMASVQYVHTQRFQSEVVSFIQHFTQLQDVLGRQRAAIQGQTVRDQAQRASRILLDIEAGAPVLLIPESSRSKNLIVANLGKLKVKNRFLFSGASGTFCLKDKTLGKSSSPIVTPEHKLYSRRSDLRASVDHEAVEGLVMASSSKPKTETKPSSAPECPDDPDEHICLLDCIVVDLQDMDIFAAERHPRGIADGLEKLRSDLLFPSYVVKQMGGSLLTERCRLKLQLERNLDKEISHSVPDMSIHGSLSSVHCSLDLSKYRLIKGLLENNLGEPVEDFMRPYDLQDPRIHTVLSGEVYTGVSFLIDMVNVSLELLEDKAEDGASHSLARFDFKKSKLLFESFSNQTKSINLVSHSMMAFDTRYTGHKPPTAQKPNVFNCILQPSKSNSNPGSLQIELHHRSTKDTSCFTVVLNNLRVFLIFDWLLLVHKFLQTPSETKKVYLSPHPEEERGGSAAVVPKTVKSGVVTKRSSVQVTPEKQLEVKINVTGTEFVVVEDASCVDTNAIILKGTTVLTYKPKLVDRPFSGSLFGIEVFSCRLGNEHDTALSIVDPVHVQIELVGNSAYQNSSGLMDAFNTEDFPPILEIQLQTLDIRLSYNDVQLFLAIAKSIPGQTSPSAPESAPSDVSGSNQGNTKENEGLVVKDVHRHVMDPLLENQLARLQELGFAVADCRKALLASQGQLNKAATWLFKNAEPLKPNKNISGTGAVRWISGLELKADSICICFIDDCMDCDVPLAEITVSRLTFFQHLVSNPDGSAEFTLSGDYYNRELSGWEPFIEPWPSAISWQQQEASRLHPCRLKVDLKAKQRLDINITSVLIEQYVNTKESWMADYCKLEKEGTVETGNEEWMGSSVDPPCIGPSLPLSYLRTRSTASLTNLEHQVYARVEMKTPKRRQPFIPFALRNHTGCTLWFATLTTTPTRAALSHSGSPEVVSDGDRDFLDDAHNVSQWREVPPGDEIPFEFETREKLRHRHTHDLRIHQLQVRVSGWEQVSPVSVDKVGIFFRYAAPDKNSSSSSVGSPISRTNIIHPQVYFSALPPVRVVFAVTMEGSARKVVTVRSSLIVKNKLEIPMELRLDSPSAPDKPVILPAVMPGDSFAVPLHLTSWRLQARPRGMGVFFCKTPIHWTNVTKIGEVSSSKRECHSMDTENSRYFRFCVALRKENYPDYMPSSIFSDSAKQIYRQPGHTIFLLPTVVICNLLPCELNFYVKGSPLKGTLKSGKEMALHTADTSLNFELGIAVENFQHCKELLIPPGTQNYMVRMRLYDTNKRQLNLTIRITCRAEGSLKIFISAPYWLINKTGW